MKTQPSLFISHGTPMAALSEDAYVSALHKFAQNLPQKPEAIVIVSAHGVSDENTVEISIAEKPQLIYDFRGFPGELYQLEYSCVGSPDLAVQIAGMLSQTKFTTHFTQTGLDHGAWIPLRHLFPAADIPVVQVSLPYPSAPETVLRLGKELATLREQGVLLIGSGGAVHNLRRIKWHEKKGAGADWAHAFEAWVELQLERKDVASLLEYESLAPSAELAHPTGEHFFPLLFTVGASLPGDRLTTIFRGIQYDSLSVLSFALA